MMNWTMTEPFPPGMDQDDPLAIAAALMPRGQRTSLAWVPEQSGPVVIEFSYVFILHDLPILHPSILDPPATTTMEKI